MNKAPSAVRARKSKRTAIVSTVAGPVAFMHPDDIGKLVVPASKRRGTRLKPNYATQEDGVDTVKVLMATDTMIAFEAFRPKGAIDTAHQHPDHHSMVYQKQGRTRMRIGDESFVVDFAVLKPTKLAPATTVRSELLIEPVRFKVPTVTVVGPE